MKERINSIERLLRMLQDASIMASTCETLSATHCTGDDEWDVEQLMWKALLVAMQTMVAALRIYARKALAGIRYDTCKSKRESGRNCRTHKFSFTLLLLHARLSKAFDAIELRCCDDHRGGVGGDTEEGQMSRNNRSMLAKLERA